MEFSHHCKIGIKFVASLLVLQRKKRKEEKWEKINKNEWKAKSHLKHNSEIKFLINACKNGPFTSLKFHRELHGL